MSNLRIQDLALDERPRERLLKYGPAPLSNSELLALVLRNGSKEENVIQLASNILSKYELRKLSRKTVEQLKEIKGIGDVKATQLLATFEIARRLATEKKSKRITATSARQIARMLIPDMSTLSQEQVRGIYLNARQHIIKQETLFVGTINESVIHPREVFSHALAESASGVILAHNHPSGDPTPSEADVSITQELASAGTILGIELIDHIIIGEKKFISMKEEGLL